MARWINLLALKFPSRSPSHCHKRTIGKSILWRAPLRIVAFVGKKIRLCSADFLLLSPLLLLAFCCCSCLFPVGRVLSASPTDQERERESDQINRGHAQRERQREREKECQSIKCMHACIRPGPCGCRWYRDSWWEREREGEKRQEPNRPTHRCTHTK